ncbi:MULTISPECIES: hypothetical protein [Thermoactinomyces]|uniref:YkoP-like domain-containing protein n=1 Tax=Thermoactinomyces daqus TaxID=1329516 RepID=A0A7W2AIT5_9BACL|nr:MULTISPECIES: hypothetical protein [Thermoactinomyces]MBA4544081.1 hypothetical protein [Thermoactinomyces daqus]MBH8598205.1 hypothetical protein [Thermoactinomyces sp. CICC 10523]MBH8603234.1 hypothetical protein [Thermoactinomyces sp. CICC 10522]MBH8608610.1 hypothetical protein [Thermoactinomyces sp. CICC 10521]
MFRQTIINLWQLWDIIYFLFTRLNYVDKGKNIFRVSVKKYRGELIQTADGAILERGDWYVQLHLHNVLLARLLLQSSAREFGWAIMLRRLISSSLPALIRFINHHPQHNEIQVILGTTLLYRNANRLGFEVSDISNPKTRWIKSLTAKCIFLLCHPNGLREMSGRKNDLIPKRVFISKKRLNQFYGSGS